MAVDYAKIWEERVRESAPKWAERMGSPEVIEKWKEGLAGTVGAPGETSVKHYIDGIKTGKEKYLSAIGRVKGEYWLKRLKEGLSR